MSPRISILLPTFNRAPVLARTLAALAAVDRSGVEVEIVIIDNASTDDTAAVVAGFRDRLPLVYLHEPRAGKNCALNRALRECLLGDLLVFIDDDITPQPGWITEIVAASERWPTIAVFGSRVLVEWPDGAAPAWIVADWVKVFGFAWHDLGNEEKPYQGSKTPMGPCYWIRKEVLARVPEFDESIGPRPTNRIMGSEMSFLTRVAEAGYHMVYCPQVCVRHRIAREECTVPALRRRAYRCGRGEIRVFGPHRRKLFARSRVLWSGALVAEAVIYSGGRLLLGALCPIRRYRAELMLRAMVRWGKIIESLRVGKTGNAQE